jgi:hypothetical protein
MGMGMAHFSMQFGRTTPGQTYKERPSVYGLCTRNDDKVALVRIGAEFPYKYDLPGGGVESGESDAEAVIREFDEETGLTVWPSRQLGRAGQFWVNQDVPMNSLTVSPQSLIISLCGCRLMKQCAKCAMTRMLGRSCSGCATRNLVCGGAHSHVDGALRTICFAPPDWMCVRV